MANRFQKLFKATRTVLSTNSYLQRQTNTNCCPATSKDILQGPSRIIPTGKSRPEILLPKKSPVNAYAKTYKELFEAEYLVDKSQFLCDLDEIPTYKNLRITMPSKFGKTTLLTLAKTYYELKFDDTFSPIYDGANSPNYEFFKNTHICTNKKELFDKNFGKRSVIYLDFSTVTGESLENVLAGFKIAIKEMYEENYKNYHEHLETKSTRTKNEKALCRLFEAIDKKTLVQVELEHVVNALSRLLAAQFENKVVLIIDEYDRPYRCMTMEPSEVERVVEFFGNFYLASGKSNKNVEHILVAGITRPNMTELSGQSFDLHINIHPQELLKYFGYSYEDVLKLAAVVEPPIEGGEIIENMQKWYNGYKFKNDDGKTEGIYNPFAMNVYLAEWRGLKNEERENMKQKNAKLRRIWGKEDQHVDINGLIRSKIFRPKFEILLEPGATIPFDADKIMLFNQATYTKLNKICKQIETGTIEEIDEHVEELLYNHLIQIGYLTREKNGILIPNEQVREPFAEALKNYYVNKYNFDSNKLNEASDALVKVTRDAKHCAINEDDSLDTTLFRDALSKLLNGANVSIESEVGPQSFINVIAQQIYGVDSKPNVGFRVSLAEGMKELFPEIQIFIDAGRKEKLFVPDLAFFVDGILCIIELKVLLKGAEASTLARLDESRKSNSRLTITELLKLLLKNAIAESRFYRIIEYSDKFKDMIVKEDLNYFAFIGAVVYEDKDGTKLVETASYVENAKVNRVKHLKKTPPKFLKLLKDVEKLKSEETKKKLLKASETYPETYSKNYSKANSPVYEMTVPIIQFYEFVVKERIIPKAKLCHRGNSSLNEAECRDLETLLSGLKLLQIIGRRIPCSFNGVSNKNSQTYLTKYQQRDAKGRPLGNAEQITIEQYFKRRHNIDLRFPLMPLIQVTLKEEMFYLPMETLVICDQWEQLYRNLEDLRALKEPLPALVGVKNVVHSLVRVRSKGSTCPQDTDAKYKQLIQDCANHGMEFSNELETLDFDVQNPSDVDSTQKEVQRMVEARKQTFLRDFPEGHKFMLFVVVPQTSDTFYNAIKTACEDTDVCCLQVIRSNMLVGGQCNQDVFLKVKKWWRFRAQPPPWRSELENKEASLGIMADTGKQTLACPPSVSVR